MSVSRSKRVSVQDLNDGGGQVPSYPIERRFASSEVIEGISEVLEAVQARLPVEAG